MTENERRELAEKHWKYTEGLIRAVGGIPTPLNHYIYVQAFLHGWKHREKKEK